MAVIAGNWKMHHGPDATRAFFEALELPASADAHELVLFPPAISLAEAVACPARDPRVLLGVQNVHWEDAGAFTGETSAGMAAESGAGFVLVGHSERRHVFGESDEAVARKVDAVLRHGLTPVVCVGETLGERREGRIDDVILGQMAAALGNVSGDEPRFLVAYEPVWAIGTGETATPADASEAQGALRGWLRDTLGAEAAALVPILYGGSVKPGNAVDLLRAPDVDGVLVGGASLEASSFAAIVAAAG